MYIDVYISFFALAALLTVLATVVPVERQGLGLIIFPLFGSIAWIVLAYTSYSIQVDSSTTVVESIPALFCGGMSLVSIGMLLFNIIMSFRAPEGRFLEGE